MHQTFNFGHLILKVTLYNRYYYCVHCTEEETEDCGRLWKIIKSNSYSRSHTASKFWSHSWQVSTLSYVRLSPPFSSSPLLSFLPLYTLSLSLS